MQHRLRAPSAKLQVVRRPQCRHVEAVEVGKHHGPSPSQGTAHWEHNHRLYDRGPKTISNNSATEQWLGQPHAGLSSRCSPSPSIREHARTYACPVHDVSECVHVAEPLYVSPSPAHFVHVMTEDSHISACTPRTMPWCYPRDNPALGK